MCQQHEDDNGSDTPQPVTSSTTTTNNSPFPWHLSIYDAHCHPTDTMSSIPLIQSQMRASALTIMATRSQDQQLVADVASTQGIKFKTDLKEEKEDAAGAMVVPSFGWHPWFSHQIQDDVAPQTTSNGSNQSSEEAKATHYRSVLTPSPDDTFIASLPSPTPLSTLLSSITTNLIHHPHALIGEIGLDKAFRLPSAPSSADPPRDDSLTPGGREGRLLSRYRVKPEHQRRILEAQLKLAGEKRRAVSVHGVQAHGLLLETVAKTWKGRERQILSRRKRRLVAEGAESSDSESDNEDDDDAPLPYPPRICLHSFSATPEVLRQWLDPSIPSRIFFSFSIAVNAASDSAREKLRAVVKEVPNEKVLVESDLHVAGEEMDRALEDMYRFVCEAKGWDLEDGVKRIVKNYAAFIFG